LIGFVDFLVKIYHPDVHPDYPLGGKFTPHLDKMKLGKFNSGFSDQNFGKLASDFLKKLAK
jgi:hypothetical protein